MAAIPGIDITRPHAARVCDWARGGQDHYEADREYGEQVMPCDSRRRPA